MKYIKLTGIFVVCAALLFLVMNWSSITTSGGKDGGFGTEDKVDIEKECREIRAAWSSATGWNAELYQKQRNRINQLKAAGMFSRKGYTTVNNCMLEEATNKACDGYINQLKNVKPFSDARLCAEYSGIRTLTQEEHMGEDARIKRVTKIHTLYSNVKTFQIALHPKFDTTSHSWTSFPDAKQRLLQRAASYRNDPMFSEISHVPGFQDKLNDAKINTLLTPMPKSYYTDLTSLICAYYQNTPKPAPEPVLNEMRQIFSQLVNEVNSSMSYLNASERSAAYSALSQLINDKSNY